MVKQHTSPDPLDPKHISKLQAGKADEPGSAEPASIPPVLDWRSSQTGSDALKQQRL